MQKPGGFLDIKQTSAIIFHGRTLTIDGVSTWKGGPWKKEFLFKLVYQKNRRLKNGKKGKRWDELSFNQKYGGKMPVLEVGLVKPPEIKLETNPKTDEDFQKLYDRMVEIRDILLEGVDIDKIQNESAYIDFNDFMDDLLSKDIQKYLTEAGPNQLKDAQNQINQAIENPSKLR